MRRAASPFRLLPIALLGLLPAAAGADDVPHPDLGRMEPIVRQRVEQLRATVDALAARPDAAPAELADGIGRLGEYYQAYELLDAAEGCYARAAELAPDSPRWAYYLGLVRYVGGKVEEAVGSFRHALELAPEDRAAHVRLGRALLDLNRLDEARQVFTALAALDPESAAAHEGLAKVADAAGDPATAARHFEQALASQPQASILHYPLGQAYRRLGEMDKAREQLMQRGQDEVTFPDPLGSEVAWLVTYTAFDVVRSLAASRDGFSEREFLGFTLSQLGGIEGAADRLAELLGRDEAPTGDDAITVARMHYAVGGLLVRARRDAEALDHFARAVALDPTLVDARLKLGNAQARLGRLAEAEETYSALLELDSDDPEALLKRSAARMELGRERPAIDDLDRLLARQPDHVEGRIRRAAAQAALGDAEAALADYRAALALDLDERQRRLVYGAVGDLLRGGGELSPAAEAYRSALALEPDSAELHFSLASVLGGLGDYRAAAAEYREVTRLDPQHAAARIGEATALLLQGSTQEAIERLSEAVEALPDSPTLKGLLARQLATAPDPALRDGDRAYTLARQAFDTLPTFDHGETVAMALAQAGRFDEAVEWEERLVEEAEKRGDHRAGQIARRHLELYRDRQPCCPAPEEAEE